MVKNMSKERIEKLKKYRSAIIYGEIGALIHDLGKLNDYFVKKQSLEGEKDSRLQEYDHGDILEYDSDERHEYFSDDEILKEKAEKLKKTLKNNIEVTYNDKSSDLYSFIRDHHKNLSEQNAFIQLLSSSDAFDSEKDRGNASDKQSICRTYYSNAFGHEREIEVNYKAERNAVYDYILDILDTCDINEIKTKRKVFLNNLRKSFSKALGMTARAANDVSLWEHSYMTASIFKALLGQSILENEFPVIKDKKEIENKKPFRIFSVGWDFFDFVSRSQTIPDVVGRIKVLEEIKEEIKNRIEAEFLLGNCIYEDDFGLHFLVPAAFDDKTIIKNQILKIFNEKTNGFLIPHLNLTDDGGKLTELLPEAVRELEKKKEIDFIPKWMVDWKDGLPRKKLICNVCGKGFYCEGDKEEICRTCKEIRNKGREEIKPQTRFIDEVAWNGREYENVALVVLNFDLENWLEGLFVRCLFIRKYDEKNLQKLKDFYNSELCSSNYDINKGFIENLLNLGALKAWVDGIDEAYNGALTQVNNRIDVYNSSGDFVKSILSNIKTSLEKLRKKLEEKDRNTVRKMFEELNKDKIEEQLKAEFRKIEDYLLGSENRDEKRKIVKKSTIAEIIEKIFLKNPSPSRLMRVWNNTKDFFEDLSTSLCEGSFVIERYILGITRSFNVDGRAWEVEISAKGKKERGEIVFDGNNGITVTPHINRFIEENKDVELKIKVTDRDWEEAENEFSVKKFKEKRSVRGYRTISVSPNMFIFLVPASKIIDFIIALKSKYIEQFGKVYGKLPLNVGVVYFKRKTPFFTVLDSARRFIGCFKVQKDLVKEIHDIKGSKISTDIGIIELPYKLGDGEIDYYHPYLIVEEGGIALKETRVKHVLSLENWEKIKIHPSFFDFEYLDTTVRRFDIVLGEDKKRTHPIVGNKGPRPYLLEDVDKFERLKEIFERIGSWTPIRDIEALAASKRQEWSEKGELGDRKAIYEELIDSALENKLRRFFDDKNWGNNVKPFLLSCIMEGSFFDAIELFESIMKMELKGGRG